MLGLGLLGLGLLGLGLVVVGLVLVVLVESGTILFFKPPFGVDRKTEVEAKNSEIFAFCNFLP